MATDNKKLQEENKKLAKANEALKTENEKLSTIAQSLEEKAAVAKLDVVVTDKYDIPADVKKEFDVINWTGGPTQVFGKYGRVDLTKLTLVQAERLAKKGFSKLRKK